MADEKILRFLTSIHVEDPASFGMRFDYVGRNALNREIVDMAICKESPWSFAQLDEFKTCLTSISYRYTLKFSYDCKIAPQDALVLFADWYLSLYRHSPTYELNLEGEKLIANFPNEEALKKEDIPLKDFQALLNWLSYHFKVEGRIASTTLVEDEPLPMKESKEEKEEAVSESPEEKEAEKEELIRPENQEELKAAQDAILNQLKENEKRMIEERNSQRLHHRGDYTPVEHINEIFSMPLTNIDVSGEIFTGETKLTKSGKLGYSFSIHDDEGAIACRAYSGKAISEDLLKKLEGSKARIRVRGAINDDSWSHERIIFVHYIDELPAKELRKDEAEPIQRTELHLHSKMSMMDGLGDMKDYLKAAKAMGMNRLAITDHGVLQGAPDAQTQAKKLGMSIIYGIEFYMFDLHPDYIFNPAPTPLLNARYCVFDLETTGLSARYDRITEFGGVLVENGLVVKRFDQLIHPGRSIPKRIQQKTHITDEMVADKPHIEEAMASIMDFIGDTILVSHNATFDVGFLNEARRRMGLAPMTNPVIDTLPISHYLFPEAAYHNLGTFSRNLGLTVYDDDQAHRADFDAEALNEAWQAALTLLIKEKGTELKHEDLANLESQNQSIYKHMREHHVCALAKDNEGLSALYELVTISNLKYLANVPKIPREDIQRLRSHLLIGSACANGEIFEIARNRSEETLIKAMSFYDYIELQPVENYSFLTYEDGFSKEDIIRTLKDIYAAAKKAGKKVVATGDVHYVNPEDKIFRDVYIAAKAIGGGYHPLWPRFRDKMGPYPNPDQHLRSTSEMLASFEQWLNEDEAREVVITNSNLIADQCENLTPIYGGVTFTPNANLPDSEKLIRELCYEGLHKHYGPNPPQELIDRMEKELGGICGHGYSVTYYIAYRIIKKANDDGYVVGSRGSVGSSFAATMSGITEVNPLAPHYHCPKCFHFEWDHTPGIKSGFDLPEKKCPDCGTIMIADGQNIPFETFLGFHAEKVPDIDLNFPPDYQAKAHDYMRVLLGADNVYRAGTIQTVEEKTAFGYVKGLWERNAKARLNALPQYAITSDKSKDEINREQEEIKRLSEEEAAKVNRNWTSYIASQCVGVKRTTGQHPGGIVVVPKDRNVYEFTAIQHPADDINANWLTTHFDYRSMHDELLKLDLLGHVDPQATRLMSLLTGINLLSIPVNDPKVLSLFDSPKALGLHANYLNFKTGTMGIPEFGTATAQKMLQTAHPKTFNDLLIISGLAHGTNVWANNAEDLINDGKATLQTVIGCRDDIMTYLISMGLPNEVSFKIMEDVRHGKGLKPDYENLMKEHQVPDFYIESCKKIAYLFPRAHATAYVTMACRVGYFKIYHPLEFYAVYFSVRSDDWDIETMIQGEQAIINKLEEYKRRSLNRDNPLSNKEEAIDKTLHIALEMVERGYHFENIDLYKSDGSNFVVDNENKALIPPFKVIAGLGEAAGNSVVEARKKGRFLSKEDLLSRSKLSQTHVKILDEMGVLKGMGETNQMSLFDDFGF